MWWIFNDIDRTSCSLQEIHISVCLNKWRKWEIGRYYTIQNLVIALNVLVIVMSRRLWPVRYVAHKRKKNHSEFWWETLWWNGHLENYKRYWRTILKYILQKQVLKMWSSFIRLRSYSVADSGFYYQKVSYICNSVQCSVSFLI